MRNYSSSKYENEYLKRRSEKNPLRNHITKWYSNGDLPKLFTSKMVNNLMIIENITKSDGSPYSKGYHSVALSNYDIANTKSTTVGRFLRSIWIGKKKYYEHINL